MTSHIKTILRESSRDDSGPLNILSFPTHERYQTNLAKTGNNFYLWQSQGIKPWVESYAPVPKGTVLMNPSKESEQIPLNVDIDLILSQNKFGQFQIAEQIAAQTGIPLISIEHTLPMDSWDIRQLESLYNMKGHVNIFISEYSMEKWGWSKEEAMVIHHGVDTEEFCPCEDFSKKNSVVLSVVNDWINRDWCCGFKLWCDTTGFPESDIPLSVVGDTPGLSESAKSTQELIDYYKYAKIFLNTSLVSPVPTSLLEAMSCGCAVVSTENCMIPEVIEHGVNGLLSNDPKELRAYVDELLNNDKLCEELGRNARKTIVEKFSIKEFLQNWNNVFYGVING